MTERLYYTDAYLTRFDARVVDTADDGRRVFLDRTAFYPTSGGQPNDVGTLGGIAVTDVVDDGDRVAHILADRLAQAPQLQGVVEWTRRFDHMQQHTGQHLLSAVFADVFGWDTLSVHFGADYATLDIATESITPSQVLQAETTANEVVTENRSVQVSFEEAALVRGLRKPSDREGALRVVSIDTLDRSACGGTHVRTTGEIGPILLRRQEKIRKATRIEFLCGARAVRRARSDYDALVRMAQGLSCNIDEVAVLVPAQREQLRAMESALGRLEDTVAGFRAREQYASLPPDASGVRRWIERRETGKAEASRAAALAFCALPMAVYLAVVTDPPALLVASSTDSGLDVARALKEALGAVGGRGGGGPRLAQGTVPLHDAAAALTSVVQSLGFDEPV